MENAVPTLVAERTLRARRAAYEDEVRRLIEATYAVVRRTGDLDPRVGEIVRTAGLSNQAFYRHFPSKDALLLAVLADGRARLVATLERRVERAGDDAAGALRAWIEGLCAQTTDRRAAENTRPWAVHGDRLAERFPEEAATARAELVAPLQPFLDAHGAQAVYHLVLGAVHAALLERRPLTRAEIEYLVAFAIRGVGDG